MRYTLIVPADKKARVEAIISKLPSHYVKAWTIAGKEGTMYYSEPTEGAVEEMYPVGQLATLTLVPAKEGTKTEWWQKPPPVYYILSGEFEDWQLKMLKDVVVATGLVKSVTYWDGKEPEVVRASVEG